MSIVVLVVMVMLVVMVILAAVVLMVVISASEAVVNPATVDACCAVTEATTKPAGKQTAFSKLSTKKTKVEA